MARASWSWSPFVPSDIFTAWSWSPLGPERPTGWALAPLAPSGVTSELSHSAFTSELVAEERSRSPFVPAGGTTAFAWSPFEPSTVERQPRSDDRPRRHHFWVHAKARSH